MAGAASINNHVCDVLLMFFSQLGLITTVLVLGFEEEEICERL
jgi:hypothetical protein